MSGRRVPGLLLAGTLAALLAPAFPAAAPAAGQDMPHGDGDGTISLALAGDAIITRSLSAYDEPPFLALRDVIREATAAFVNLEILLHDYEADVIPQAESGGTYMRASPKMAGELAWMGFDLVSTANNHTMDYGVGGLRRTLAAVEEAGLVHAGSGENLAEARAPAYLETPGGRVALISVASTFDDFMRAGEQRKDLRGRPGLAPLRYRTTWSVPERVFDVLAQAADSLDRGGRQDDGTVRFMGDSFREAVGEDAWGRSTEPRTGDLEEVLAAVRDAGRQANWVIVASHSHEGAESREVPAEFLVAFARAAVEAGADVFVGHGPHVLRGVEIHRGRPIFYSLANFLFQNETVALQPADNYAGYDLGPDALPSDFYDARNEARDGGFPADSAYWESVVPVVRFREGSLERIELHPITLGYGLPRPQRGRPLLAPGELGRKIVDDVRRLSEPFGTRVEWRDGIGVIEPAEDRSGGG